VLTIDALKLAGDSRTQEVVKRDFVGPLVGQVAKADDSPLSELGENAISDRPGVQLPETMLLMDASGEDPIGTAFDHNLPNS
jgi:hypothetical protein